MQLYQQLDYPTVQVDIDREKAGLSGVAVKDVTDALLGGHFFQPLRGQKLLARSEVRRRLPGAGPGPHAADEPAAAGGNPAASRKSTPTAT